MPILRVPRVPKALVSHNIVGAKRWQLATDIGPFLLLSSEIKLGRVLSEVDFSNLSITN
jgi:hypothetical protein